METQRSESMVSFLESEVVPILFVYEVSLSSNTLILMEMLSIDSSSSIYF